MFTVAYYLNSAILLFLHRCVCVCVCVCFVAATLAPSSLISVKRSISNRGQSFAGLEWDLRIRNNLPIMESSYVVCVYSIVIVILQG